MSLLVLFFLISTTDASAVNTHTQRVFILNFVDLWLGV